MEEKILEKMLDNLIQEAGPIAIQNMVKDDVETLENEKIEFSKEHEEKMKKIFAEAKKVETTPRKTNIFKKVAVISVAVILVSGLTINLAGALHDGLIKYFVSKDSEYSTIGNKHVDSDFLVDNIYFGYIPEGLKFNEICSFNNLKHISFFDDDKYFILESQKAEWSEKINTESGDITEILINEKNMFYSEREDLRILTWYENNCIQSVSSNLNEEILFKIVKNIKFLEN